MRLSAALTAATALLLGAALLFETAIRTVVVPETSRFLNEARRISDRNGKLLWAFLSPDDRWRWVTRPEDLSPIHRAMLIAYEDKRFLSHNGVDIVALGRAAWQALRHGRIVSGGSTITMQTARLLDPKPRSVTAKINEIFAALRLERHFTKDEILTLYLTLTGFGGNIEGVTAASLGYFDKPPSALTPKEAALLIALPQSPETRRPDRYPEVATRARDQVLARMITRNVAPADVLSSPGAEAAEPRFRRAAPHFAVSAARKTAGASNVVSTLDAVLQHDVESVTRRSIGQWAPPVNLAVVVLRNRDASVAAYSGGVQFADPLRAGHVDLAGALRSPGSALKPFVYGLALEALIVHPDTIVTDMPVHLDGYRPENFDGTYSGELTVRAALSRSVNTTAVALMDAVGPGRFLARLRGAGIPLATPAGETEAGLAIALGGVGISLLDLTRLYAALGSDGRVWTPRFLRTDPTRQEGVLVSPAAARSLADILADVGPPPGFAHLRSANGGRRIAYKTGTSYGFRDAWAVGFDHDHTVGVWIGRPDGRPHRGNYGVTAAAPVLMRIFALLPTPTRDVASRKASYGSLKSPRQLPPRLRRFVSRGQAAKAGPIAISFPRNRSVIGSGAGTPSGIPLVAEGGNPPYRWFVDGEPVERVDGRVLWRPEGVGQVNLLVIDASGATARASFWLDG